MAQEGFNGLFCPLLLTSRLTLILVILFFSYHSYMLDTQGVGRKAQGWFLKVFPYALRPAPCA